MALLSEEVTFLPKTVLGILDLRSLGYFKVNYEDSVRRMGGYFTFFHYFKETSDGTPDPIFNRMHKISSDVRQDTNSTKDPYPWLEPDDPRRHQTDAEILRSLISLRGLALTSKIKSNIMTMILKYKKLLAFEIS